MAALVFRSLFTSLGILTLTAEAPASPDRFEVLWKVEPTKIDAPAAVTVKRSEEVASTRLIPERLFLLEADAVSSERGLIAVKGSELALAHLDSGGVAACIINAFSVQRRTGRSARANQINTCLLDANADGKFEHFFAFRSALLTVGAVGHLRGLEPIAPTSYREDKPESSRDSWYLQLRASREGGRLRFEFCPSANPNSPNPMCLTPSIPVSLAGSPQEIEIAGSRFHVEAQPEVRVQQVTGFESQTFRIKNWISR